MNEKRVAAALVSRRNSPAVMVIPDRETPGHNASACAVPITSASPKVDSPSLRVRSFLESAHHISRAIRSEEHTSELQSRFDLVCRLLLEKKKQIETRTLTTSLSLPIR